MNSAFQFLCRTKTAFGSHALFHLSFDLSCMNAHKPFVITDQAACDAGLDLQLARAFQDAHVPLGIAVLEDTSEMESLYRLFVDKGYDSIIVLGTGMVVQTAKALNLALCTGPETLRSSAGPRQINASLLPLAVIPTHPGSGQETTGETTFLHHVFASPFLMPDLLIITADTMLGTPCDVVMDSGLTSLALCCEAFVFSDNPFVRSFAGPGICMVMENLIFLVQNPGKEELLCQKAGKDRRQPLAQLAHAAALSGFIRSNVPDLKTLQAGLHAGEPGIAPKAGLSRGLCMVLALLDMFENSKDTSAWLGKLLLPLTDAQHYATVCGTGQADAAIQTIRDLLQKLSRILSKDFGTLEQAGLTNGQVLKISEPPFLRQS